MLPSESDVDSFLDSVSEVSRLIDGLKAGTISPEYVDSKIEKRSGNKQTTDASSTSSLTTSNGKAKQSDADDAAQAAEEKQAELQRKVEDLKASRQRKLKARQLYDSYVQGKREKQHDYATDYAQWDLWCPSDEEDDLFNSVTPNTPQFRAMEKDINDRHARMVEQRQIAERQRQLGNAAFKACQYSEALGCYEAGLEAQRHNMALHANAAMAALKLKCYVQALEHCDKVLHLAEVLYNTPMHPLCVKALQRRAAAQQALGHHKKAVADLQAASVILPGDAEVMSQLQRAQALLDEHKTAKKLNQQVSSQQEQPQQPGVQVQQLNDRSSSSGSYGSGSSDCRANSGVSASSSSAINSTITATCNNSAQESKDSVCLQRIKQLTEGLSLSTTSTGNVDGNKIVASCAELQGLLVGAPFTLFFRKCGGLASLAKLVTHNSLNTAMLTACLRLLKAACDTDIALEQCCSEPHLLATVIKLVGHTDSPVAGAAVDLAYTASTCSHVRGQLCEQLVDRKVAGEEAACNSRLEKLWEAGCSAPKRRTRDEAARQILAVSLLSNCMLVPAARTAMLSAMQQHPDWLSSLAQQLQQSNTGAWAAKVYGLISNMANHPGLRGAVSGNDELLQQLLQAAVPAGSPGMVPAANSDRQLAALGCMCNLSLDQSVQQELARHAGAVDGLLSMAAWVPTSSSGSSSSCSNGGTSMSMSCKTTAAVGAPKLPPRAKDKKGSSEAAQQQASGSDNDTPSSLETSADGRRSVLAERAACLLSRMAKVRAGAALLQEKGAISRLVSCLTAYLASIDDSVPNTTGSSSSATQEPSPQQQLQAQDVRADNEASTAAAAGWKAAVMRTIALLTAEASHLHGLNQQQAAGMVRMCCRVLGSPAADEMIRGNAALILGHVAAAGNPQWQPSLIDADAVQVLVSAARAGKGSASSRNAGIALAHLARAGGVFLERLRELRGLEVIYEYVRP